MKKEIIYYIGFIKKSDRTVIVQARLNKDLLSCELWKYYGAHINTKKQLRDDKFSLLQEINKGYKTNFKHIIID